jgi:hypothetical protein
MASPKVRGKRPFRAFAAVLLPEQGDQGSETSKRRKRHAIGFARVKWEENNKLCFFLAGRGWEEKGVRNHLRGE